MHKYLLNYFALSCALGALILTSYVSASCDAHQRWFAVTILPVVTGFTSSFLWGREAGRKIRTTPYTVLTFGSLMLFFGVTLYSIMQLPRYRVMLLGLTVTTFQGIFITYHAGRSATKAMPAKTMVEA